MDTYIEELVQKKKEAKEYAITALLILGGIILTMFFVMLMLALPLVIEGAFVQMITMLCPILILALWYGVYILNTKLSIEYEYILINSSFDVDKIMSKKGRKRVVSIDIKDATLIASTDDNMNNHIYKNPSGVKIINCSALSETLNTYFIDCTVEGERSLILIQPTSKMIEAFSKFNPRAVKINS